MYKYAKALRTYIYTLKVNKRLYSQINMFFMYLSHLDSPEYVTIKDIISTVIENTRIQFQSNTEYRVLLPPSPTR